MRLSKLANKSNNFIYNMIKIMSSIEKLSWSSSKEIKKKLKISDCGLMHLRMSGEIEFMKIGNAFFYSTEKIKTK